jgi:ornithine decarboxylase
MYDTYFPAVKCNPDPVIDQTLAILGVNFDCASRNEIRLVESVSKDLPRKPGRPRTLPKPN